MPSTALLPRRARLRAPLTAAIAALAVLGAAAGPALAADPPDGFDVVSTFRVDYTISSVWTHDQGFQSATSHDTLGYEFSGSLPHVRFSNQTILDNASAVVRELPVDGNVSLMLQNPEGTSVTCVSTSVRVTGLVGIGRARRGFWFAPWIAPRATGSCTDTDGGSSPMDFSLTATAGQPQAESTPPGAANLVPSFDELETGSWQRDFNIIAADDATCPKYESSSTISCRLELRGNVKLTRISRELEQNDNDLLAPVETKKKPKLDRKKTKAETSVRCPSRCDIEAIIGVFAGTKERPRVIKLRSKKQRLKANRTTTIRVPLNAAARAAAKRGVAVMQLKVKVAGKQRTAIYPLT